MIIENAKNGILYEKKNRKRPNEYNIIAATIFIIGRFFDVSIVIKDVSIMTERALIIEIYE